MIAQLMSAEYPSASVVCSCGRLDGEDANSRNAGKVVSLVEEIIFLKELSQAMV